ncbi:MAG: TolC family outer membrane protein [Minwuia sp.]|uniref:TolC family outer membrane protein n=1 Tax=Minwuia sp. TaxID=2493630 RepID=UPI003A885C81
MVARYRSVHRPLLTAAGALCLLGLSAAASAETLRDALVAAYATNPTIQAERANQRANDENVNQAISGWKPTVIVTGDLGAQLNDQEVRGIASTNSTLPANANLNIVQPLYEGGTVDAQIESAEALVKAGQENLRSTEQDVLLDVVTVYLDVLQNYAVVQLNLNNEERLERQLEAAKDRFEVGEITRTDVSQAEAALSRAAADRAQAEGNLIAARAAYSRAVGNAPGQLEPPPPLPQLPASEDEAVTIAQAENPDLLAAMSTANSAKADIRATSGQLLPQVDLEGLASHQRNGTQGGDFSNTLRLRGVVTVPLYQQGAVYSGVRQQRNVHNQRRLQVQETQRLVIEGVTQAWEALETARARITAGRAEVRANEIALEGVIQEAQVGSRTTLDVLDAEQDLLDSQVALVQSERDEYVAAFQLLDAIGRLDVASLGLDVEVYDPTIHYRETRDRWYGTDGGLD